MIYLDASAIITLVSGRSYASELRDFLATHPGLPMATSTIGFVETVRTLDRVGDFPDTMSDLVRTFTEILLTEEVRDTAALLPAGVRTLDAIHVASAQIIGPALTALVTYDRRMLDVARSIGLPCSAPGLDERQA
ncbi:type II toxin-antitoxin system VapC family toxin [Micromonospora sp. ALFpr18c]|uniref:type II toxin-antitoxin system VapC family toxin n=1 Tax=unclassified Micromonospora TaxID=2617518 RepID=UPI00124B9085|nr:type II toxin-antitoxin system VapC family toxin [Micromonospora sp. ALFpr18c]KAB1945418.1 type II toxin-antitoxin system VapC family toxin [Micromonospora sp. ALFpr18c]